MGKILSKMKNDEIIPKTLKLEDYFFVSFNIQNSRRLMSSVKTQQICSYVLFSVLRNPIGYT